MTSTSGPTGADHSTSSSSADPAGAAASRSDVEPAPADTEDPKDTEDTEERQTVSIPALEDTSDVLTDGGPPAGDPGDHRGQPWSTSPGSQALDQESGTDEDIAPARTEGKPEAERAPEPDDESADDDTSTASSAAFDHATERDGATPGEQTSRGRRESGYDEVVDGGFGIGSAAPIADGAQPLGHPVKAWHDRKSYLMPGDQGYDDGRPDLWFYNEESARRAGFRPAHG